MATRKYDATATADALVAELADEIKGKVILTTGVSPGGIGATFVEAIAKAHPALLILAGRNVDKVAAVAALLPEGVKTRVLQLDLASLAAVRAAADIVRQWKDVEHIDVVVNNAAIMATDFALSPDGFESQLATNHLGHFLFTNLIMDKILASKAPRVVNVSSDGHRLSPIRWADLNFSHKEETPGATYNKWTAYGQSKTANMLMAISLAEKLGPKHGLLAYSLHPGVILSSNLGNHIDWTADLSSLRELPGPIGAWKPEGWSAFKTKTAQEGAATHVYAAFEPSLKAHNGAYLEDSHVADPWIETVKPWATNSIEAERLWKLSQELVDQEFKYEE
ncbi:retinol dehydrogenase 13 [Mycena rosella]|uniref:Retinol dehydrogenase 13 n=1 Tax=Mycena rosella TaxID=1033263 RepID=A0AAD7GKP5_MYCRO|nr:retinol dehydrogenase 13 [Mycena rosella]